MQAIEVLKLGAPVALLLAAACDSTSPRPDGPIVVTGRVLEAGSAPAPPLPVEVVAWPAPGAGGIGAATMLTDAAGGYTAELGPFPGGRPDSVRVRVTQSDCAADLPTELMQRDLAGRGDPLVVPDLALAWRLLPAELSAGQAMCGVTGPAPGAPGGDLARLALWIDQVADSVKGRWRLNHSISIGDESGHLRGIIDADRLVLVLEHTDPAGCTAFDLEIPFEQAGGSTLGAGSLEGGAGCSITGAVLRFFQGAVLSEPLPPEGA